MAHAYMLMIGEANSKPDQAEQIAEWHQEQGVWLSNERVRAQVGAPVVARLAGRSNELLLDGHVSGPIEPSVYADKRWAYQIRVDWSPRIVRGVRAGDVLGPTGKVRPAKVALSEEQWSAIQTARLANATEPQ
jgi:hypothetical protein